MDVDISEMAGFLNEPTQSPAELLGLGKRHYAVRDFNSAAEVLARACECLAIEHGDAADECAEAYFWYGKALLCLSREESKVLGDGVPGSGNEEDDDDEESEDQENEEDSESEQDESGEEEIETKEVESTTEKPESTTKKSEPTTKEPEPTTKKPEPTTKEPESSKKEPESTTKELESTTKDDLPATSADAEDNAEPSTTNGEANEDSLANIDNEEEIDNLQLAWEMLDLARTILFRRLQQVDIGGKDDEEYDSVAHALLADVYLALGEVAIESETYDKAVKDMQSCLDIQETMYEKDDRRIAETHYQMGLANSLASNVECAVTNFKNAVKILETRIMNLEKRKLAADDATVKKSTSTDPLYTIDGEIKELKELLPQIQEKIQDMMDYKAESIKRVHESLGDPTRLCQPKAECSSLNGAGPSTSAPQPAASDISHLVKRKKKPSESDSDAPPAKKANT